jgi:hypothetical protein
MDSETPHRVGLTSLNSKSTSASSTWPKQVEVVVHTAHEQYPSNPTALTDQDVHNDSPERFCDKPRSLGLGDDVESRV